MTPPTAAHIGKRVLLVEDEMLVAMMLEDALIIDGCEVRKAARVCKALDLIQAEWFDAAVLDVNLNGEPVFPVAAALRERNVPFLFSSGYGEQSVPLEYRTYVVLQKPYKLERLQSALQELLSPAILPHSE